MSEAPGEARASALHAFGSDRCTRSADGTSELTCAVGKGWTARKPGAQTSPEHPGTAVSWAGEILEVLEATPLADGGTRYRLAPWDSRHAIRVLERYDADNERARSGFRADLSSGEKKRKLSILLAPVLGHLPADVQERMEKNFGASALWMTITSALPLFVLGVLSLLSFLAGSLGARLYPEAAGTSLFPWLSWLPFPVGLYLFAESAIRLASAAATSRPCGSLPGVLAYEVWRIVRTRGPADAPATSAPAAARMSPEDRFRLMEPLLALLTPAEQELLASRFGFDPIRWGRRTSAALMAFAWLNIGISLLQLAARTGRVGDFVWLVVGIGLLVEQLSRRRALARGAPAGSLLGAVVRPFARELLRPGT